MYVCMCTCMNVSMYMYIHVHVCLYVSCTFLGRYVLVCMYVCMYGATGTVWNLKLNTSYLGDAREWQREHLRITSCLVYILWDYVARTRTSTTRRPIRVVTQRVATFMTLTTLVI